MSDNDAYQRVEDVRRFNRFYTKQIGILHEGLLGSPFSLAEARVLYELAHREKPTATELAKELGLDAGYLSRIFRGFQKRDLIEKLPSPVDGRQSLLVLTAQGRETFAPLNTRSHEEIDALLSHLAPTEQKRLIEAMHSIEQILDPQPQPKPPYLLRPHQPGDMGWVVYRHGAALTRQNTVGMNSLRPWLPKSWRSSSSNIIRNKNAAGSLRSTAKLSARCFSSNNPMPWLSCGYCWLSPQAGKGSAPV